MAPKKYTYYKMLPDKSLGVKRLIIIYANNGLKLLNLLELTFVFRNVLVFCHFFLEKK
jgi:hypothetical protein